MEGGIQEAPGFIRFMTLLDPESNTVDVPQYLRDPLLPDGQRGQ